MRLCARQRAPRLLDARTLWLVHKQRDSTGDQVAGGCAGIDLDQLYGEGQALRAQYEAIRQKLHIAQGKVRPMRTAYKVGRSAR